MRTLDSFFSEKLPPWYLTGFAESAGSFTFSRSGKQLLLVRHVLKAIEKTTWQGLIAKILGTKIYLNAGRRSGLVTGDILKVLTKGIEVFDPETGALLGKTEGQLKGTLEVIDFIGDDAAVCQSAPPMPSL